MFSYTVVSLALLACVAGDVVNSGGSAPLVGDSPQARQLFFLADDDHDLKLTLQELHTVFLHFDLNNDSVVTSTEFFAHWHDLNMGSDSEAITLFFNIDVNRDLQITEDIDMPLILRFFDRNYDGVISEGEFVIQWVKIST